MFSFLAKFQSSLHVINGTQSFSPLFVNFSNSNLPGIVSKLVTLKNIKALHNIYDVTTRVQSHLSSINVTC